MKISSIEFNERITSMATVYLENNVSFCLPKKRIQLLELVEGKSLSEETLNYILDTEVYASAKSSAVNYLALKLRTSFEVRQKLQEMGYDENTIEKVIGNLNEINYIDDNNYAQKYLREKTRLKPKSARLLSMELKQKGIADEIINNAFEEFELDEGEVALELLRKRYSRHTAFDDKLIQKMKSFLMSRGFNYSQISRAISSFLPDE
ncbi:MAG: regulatory protein RecX [Eubacterium sp.]|jgi:regulatory protein|nr:regulatory protein RecX [Eubacterium sp.]